MMFLAGLVLAAQAVASPNFLVERQGNCPKLHIFGARETTAPAGYGTSQSIVQAVQQAHPGATTEALNYPACGGQSQCGGIQYGDSVKRGTAAAAQAINAFNKRCPDTEIVLVGYSQGGQVFDNAVCGGGDSNSGISETASPLTESAQKMVKAAVFLGDPRHIPGSSYNVGTCRANGVSFHPFVLGTFR
jgi:acetylxylan esterase